MVAAGSQEVIAGLAVRFLASSVHMLKCWYIKCWMHHQLTWSHAQKDENSYKLVRVAVGAQFECQS